MVKEEPTGTECETTGGARVQTMSLQVAYPTTQLIGPAEWTGEQPFLRALFGEPDNGALRLVYADWLDERGDPRGEFLRLTVLRKRSGRPGEQAASRLCRLRRGIDARWAAIVDDLDCRVGQTRTASVAIPLAGRAPARFGAGAVRVRRAVGSLLRWLGWEHVGGFLRHVYLIPPPSFDPERGTMPVEVPTDAELERIGLALHLGRERRRFRFGPWTLRYEPEHDEIIESVQTTAVTEFRSCELYPVLARFDFCMESLWGRALVWDQGTASRPHILNMYPEAG
jgi:uncharacterized protein (TIGR02996 family)